MTENSKTLPREPTEAIIAALEDCRTYFQRLSAMGPDDAQQLLDKVSAALASSDPGLSDREAVPAECWSGCDDPGCPYTHPLARARTSPAPASIEDVGQLIEDYAAQFGGVMIPSSVCDQIAAEIVKRSAAPVVGGDALRIAEEKFGHISAACRDGPAKHIGDIAREGLAAVQAALSQPPFSPPLVDGELARRALEAVDAAMLNGGDGTKGDFGWNIITLNRARPLIREALATRTDPPTIGTSKVQQERLARMGRDEVEPLSPDKLAKLRELLTKAPPELFMAKPERIAQMLRDGARAQRPQPDNLASHDFDNDGALIVAAVNALPALLALAAERIQR